MPANRNILKDSVDRYVETLSGVPVIELPTSPATFSAAFDHSDFSHPLHASNIQDIAVSIAASIPHKHWACGEAFDVIVAVADRTLGAIVHELSRIFHMPYSLINWYPDGSPGDVLVETSKGFSGSGVSYLNGLTSNMKVLIISDTFDTTLLNVFTAVQKAGSSVAQCSVLVDWRNNTCSNQIGKELTETYVQTIFSVLAVVDKSTSTTLHDIATTTVVQRCDVHPENIFLHEANSCHYQTLQNRLVSPPTVKQICALPAETITATLRKIEEAFVGIPIVMNPSLQYPYSFFQLTDFIPIMTHDVVEDMADLSIRLSKTLQEGPNACGMLVSETDRGGGPLIQAIAQRLHIPYVMAMWATTQSNAVAASGSSAVRVQIGFSGNGTLVVNGLQHVPAATPMVFIDDMLSSGGTAEGVLRAVEAAGGRPVEAVFVSEKLYMNESVPRKGYARLKKIWPDLLITTLVQFVAAGERTSKIDEKLE